jgi:hypothetical protein
MSKLQGTALLRGIPSVEHPALEAWFLPRRTEMLPPSPPSAQRKKPPASVGKEGKEGSVEAAAPAPHLRQGRRGAGSPTHARMAPGWLELSRPHRWPHRGRRGRWGSRSRRDGQDRWGPHPRRDGRERSARAWRRREVRESPSCFLF